MSISLSLLSWNLHGVPFVTARRERFRRVAARVLDGQPDIVLFQEVWLRRDAAQLSADLEASYTPIPSPPSKQPLRTSGLLGFVRRASGWGVGATRFHPFDAGAPAWKFWEGDGLGRKGVHEIQLVRGGTSVLVLNTHLQASYPWNDYEAVRRPQLAQFCSFATRLDRRCPVIAGGDLNTHPREALYDDLLAHWNDLTAPKREQSRCGTHINGNGAVGDWIDYILARRYDPWEVYAEDMTLIESTRPDFPYSDHQGLQAQLHLHARVAQESNGDGNT